MLKRISTLLAACIFSVLVPVSALASPARSQINWAGGPPVIADPDAPLYDPQSSEPSSYIEVRGTRYETGSDQTVYVIAGEYVQASCEWHVNPADIAAGFDRSQPDPHESYSWWLQEQNPIPYSSDDCVQCDDHAWSATMQFTAPGYPFLRFDYRYTNESENPEDAWSKRFPAFAPPVHVYEYVGKDVTGLVNSRVALPRNWLIPDPGVAGYHLTVDVDSFEAAKKYPGVTDNATLTAAVGFDGVPFSEEDRLEAENSLEREHYLNTNATSFTPPKPGIYEWTFSIDDHPEVPPAVIYAKVFTRNQAWINERDNRLFDIRAYHGRQYLVRTPNRGGLTGEYVFNKDYTISDLIKLDPAWDVTINNPDGSVFDPDTDILVTGTTVTVSNEFGSETGEFIIATDLTGRGAHGGLPNVVRMAKAMNGSEPLEPPLLWAADLNNNGKVDAADLVKAVQLMYYSE